MIQINTAQLREEADQFLRCARTLSIQAEELLQVCRGLEQELPLKESIPKLHSIINKLTENTESVVHMGRSLEQIASLFERCERTVEANCDGRTESSTYYTVDEPLAPFTLLK